MAEHETIRVDRRDDGVVWVTLDRPERHNAFDSTMCAELSGLWRSMRTDDSVRCIVLTGAGDRAFCTGMDRSEMPIGDEPRWDPLSYEDPGRELGPKASGLWKPVVAAVNGMACGGAFYLLGEVEVIVAAEHATFFDPHLTFGMTAVYEPALMLHRMPFGELARLTLLGNSERMSARRAHEIGLVSEVVPASDLAEAAGWVASTIASQPPRAVQATVRALWAARELTRAQALDLGATLLHLGVDAEDLEAGERAFRSGGRTEWRTR